MTMKQDLAPSPPLPPPSSATCGNCGADEGRILHQVRHRGLFRRLCTTCVLRLHPQSFCPSCFSPPPPATAASVSCSKCYSSSHPECAPTPAPATTPYTCPLCRNPSSPVFILNRIKPGLKRIDRDSARLLLAAAKIAALSMAKAAVVARAEAERRAKEAAFTRKRAREALEHVAYLEGKEKKAKRRERPLAEASVKAVDGASEVFTRLNAVGLIEKERININNGLQHTQNKLGGEENLGPQ